MTRDSYAVRLYEPELADACDRFARRVWPEHGGRDGAGGNGHATAPPPRVLFLKGGEVIGHVATVPVRLAVAGRLLNAAWAVGLMVVPEHRSGPIAPLMVKKLNQTLEIGLTLHVEEAALRVFKGVGWRHLGVIPQYVRVLNARRFVRTFVPRVEQFCSGRWSWLRKGPTRISTPVAAFVSVGFAGLAILGTVRRWRVPGAAVVEERGFDPSYTQLAERVKGKFGVWVFRDQSYLAERYGRRLGAYRLFACRADDGLRGYCILKLRQFERDPRMGDLRMGTIVDCVFDPDEPEVLDSLLQSAVTKCRRENIDVVFCSASLGKIGQRLRRHAFIPMPGTLNVAFHDRTDTIGANVPLGSWHVMRGDSDADANC